MLKNLTAFLLLLLSGCEAENTSPYILQATYDSGPSSSFAFRKDRTFRWSNGSGLGVSETDGKYSIKDSVITLDEIGFDKVVKSKRLLITTIHPNSKAVGKYVIQVDGQNRLIDSMFIFTVYLDRRDSL
jgi:hypothetical protein